MDHGKNIKKNTKAKKTTKNKAKRVRKPSVFGRVFAVVFLLFVMYAILLALVAGGVLYSFNKSGRSPQAYSLRLNSEGKRLYYFDAEEVNNAYGFYVPFENLSVLCDLSIIGDKDKIIVSVNDSSGSVVCSNNSSLVYVNHNPVRLSSPVLFYNDFLLPVELIDNYFLGLTVEYDIDNYVCNISREEDFGELMLKMESPAGIEKPEIPLELTNQPKDP